MDKTYIHKFLFAQFIYYFYEKFIYLHFITFKHKQNEPSNDRFLPLFNHIPWPLMGPNDSIGIILVFYFKEEALSFPKHYLLLLLDVWFGRHPLLTISISVKILIKVIFLIDLKNFLINFLP